MLSDVEQHLVNRLGDTNHAMSRPSSQVMFRFTSHGCDQNLSFGPESDAILADPRVIVPRQAVGIGWASPAALTALQRAYFVPRVFLVSNINSSLRDLPNLVSPITFTAGVRHLSFDISDDDDCHCHCHNSLVMHITLWSTTT